MNAFAGLEQKWDGSSGGLILLWLVGGSVRLEVVVRFAIGVSIDEVTIFITLSSPNLHVRRFGRMESQINP